MKSLLFSLLFGISAAAAQAPLGKLLSRQYSLLQANEQTPVLITFKDKGSVKQGGLRRPESLVSERSLRRRLKVRDAAHVVDEQDLPLDQAYVSEVASMVSSIRHQLKWFNMVSAMATKQQIEEVRRLPFVAEVELIGRWRARRDDEKPEPLKNTPSAEAPAGTTALDYGTSFTQVNQINVPALHNLGFYGQGVVVGVFDNGFRNLAHQAFDSMHIIATYDFVDHKVSVIPFNPGTGFGSHGVWTLSTIGGFRSGNLIGPAFKANFILARTENDSSETPIEEDNWAKALEWADSIGVDVTSTSLGYLTFDPPYTNLTWADMNGHTALITNAADRAVGLGIVVVNSAGNSGFNASRNTLIAPADGDSVITAGAVTSSGTRSAFSSVGPTTDNPPRIKPDIMAMGSGVKAASAIDTISYVSVSGTSFSCPLSAGVAALILSANPSLTPIQVREAMRQTASNVCAPNNLMGWGILNARAAAKYYAGPPSGLVNGTVFDDLNGSGSRDPGEPGLENVKVRLGCTRVDSTLTDLNGNFVFDSLRFGLYSVSEDVPAGWTRSLPPSGSYSATLDSINPEARGEDFGNFRPGSVTGMKFNDFNRDGVQDSGEGVVTGWLIRLVGPQTLRTTTDTAGNYRFTGVVPGLYAVQETTLTDWFQTAPGGNGTHSVLMRSRLDTTGFDFGNYYAPPNGYPVTAGWNLLSLPQDPADHGKGVLYPGAVSRAFSYSAAGGYGAVDPIPNGVGFWLKFLSPQIVPIVGTVRTTDSVGVSGGWNLIGSLSNPVAVSAIIQIPDGNVVSPYFSFYGSYSPHDTLKPHRGYFVKTSGAGTLVLSASSRSIAGEKLSSLMRLDESANRITIEDSKGNRQVLYFGRSEVLRKRAGFFALPPLPPEGAFDARFSNGSLAWIPREGHSRDAAAIEIRSAAYPIMISWKLTAADEGYALAEGSPARRTELTAAGSLTVRDPECKVLRLQSATGNDLEKVPRQYGLEQNYPNPFNPATTIGYRLSADGRVKLEIFNVIGREVRLLVDKDQRAGAYTTEWDGKSTEGFDLTSGIYIAKLTVASGGRQVFTSTKKTILMK